MFQVMGMFLYQGHVSVSMACFPIKGMFMYRVHVSSQGHVLVQRFLSILRSIFLFVRLYVYVFLCFIISIHSKDIHPKITSSFCRFLCFMSYIFNMCHIFIVCTSFMFYIFYCFLIVIFLFSFL
jgi:hypothetical protein